MITVEIQDLIAQIERDLSRRIILDNFAEVNGIVFVGLPGSIKALVVDGI